MTSCDYCGVITGNNGPAHCSILQRENGNNGHAPKEVEYPKPVISPWETLPNGERPTNKKAEKKTVTFRIDKNSTHSVPRIDDSRSGAYWLFLSFKRRQKKEASKKISKKGHNPFRFSNGLVLDSSEDY